jgi:hypothetical protein
MYVFQGSLSLRHYKQGAVNLPGLVKVYLAYRLFEFCVYAPGETLAY